MKKWAINWTFFLPPNPSPFLTDILNTFDTGKEEEGGGGEWRKAATDMDGREDPHAEWNAADFVLYVTFRASRS